MNDPPTAPAVARNRQPILAVLLEEFQDRRHVLEIGSGTGEHAVYFGPRLPWLTWQTSDRRAHLDDIRARLRLAEVSNVEPPLELDVADPPALKRGYDAVFSANTAHIMSLAEVESMFTLVGELLPDGGKFSLYGPFNRHRQYTSASNARFDESLRLKDPKMGIRDLEDLDAFAAAAGMRRSALHEMPANNHIAVWIRSGR